MSAPVYLSALLTPRMTRRECAGTVGCRSWLAFCAAGIIALVVWRFRKTAA